MQLPHQVESVLSAQGVRYVLVPNSKVAVRHKACSVLLSDESGRVQALFPDDCLLDLAALTRFAGRDFTPVIEQDPTVRPPPLSAIPTVPDVPMVVDRRLLESEHVLLQSGDGETLIDLERDQFAQLLSGSGTSMGDFTIPLSELTPFAVDGSADIEEISNAVGKFTTRRIEKRLEDTLDFPALPEIAHRIIQIGADPYASVKDLVRVVEVDASLAAQVVSWASSPYYAAPGKITSIQDAIVRVLGFDMVMNLALGLALGKTMRLPRDGRYGYRNYWLQSVYGAAMMEGLCKAMPSGKRPPLGFAYLSGLLHNFGFLILSELFKPQLQLVCRYVEANPHVGHVAVERHLLGITREQMAALLMRFWHLPEEICTAIRFQHDPDQAGEHQTMACVLNLAVRLLAAQGVGSASAEPIPDELYQSLGISRDDGDKVWQRIHNSADNLKAIAHDLAA
jgi:HD-like signal output (HDOD) protein